MIEEAAIGLLADWLRTPLQIEQHLNLAFDHGFRSGVKPITAEVVETVLSRQLDELEPRLIRHGYNVKSLATQFHAKPAEIRPSESDQCRAGESLSGQPQPDPPYRPTNGCGFCAARSMSSVPTNSPNRCVPRACRYGCASDHRL